MGVPTQSVGTSNFERRSEQRSHAERRNEQRYVSCSHALRGNTMPGRSASFTEEKE